MDLTSPKLMYLKAGLFLLGGAIAGAAIVLEHPTWKMGALLAITVWCFARAYYFAFYVIERYIDPSFRFSGLGSFVRHLVTRKKR